MIFSRFLGIGYTGIGDKGIRYKSETCDLAGLVIRNYKKSDIQSQKFKTSVFIKFLQNLFTNIPLYIYTHLPLYRYTYIALFLLFISFSLSNFGCGVYSFTGASVPTHLRTIGIPVADDRSGSGEPGLRELITDQLTQKFIDDNTLQVTERTGADAVLECTITQLSDAPSVVTAGETVQTRRVTLTINVTYRDLVQRKTIYDKNFSNYGDYPSGGSITQRRDAIETAVNRITEDILLDTVSGW